MLSEFLIFFIGLALVFLYVIKISSIFSSWQNNEETRIGPTDAKDITAISIIISARNEAKNIRSCLDSVLSLDYPVGKLEIIVIDDNSEDTTFEIASSYSQILVIQNNRKGKKAAMAFGASISKNPWLWFLDADTILHKDAAKLAHAKIAQTDANFIACPIMYPTRNGFLNAFQILDASVTMAVTAAGIMSKQFYSANGANMLVKKQAFMQVGGFNGNEEFASGDDVFLIQKMAQLDDSKVVFLKSRRMAAITKDEDTWSGFFQQRKRWATKSSAYTHGGLKKIQASVFAMHLAILLWIVASTIYPIAFFVGLLMLFVKGVIDYLLIQNITHFFEVKDANKWFIPAFFFYFLYLFFMAAHAIFPSTYRWKGRENK